MTHAPATAAQLGSTDLAPLYSPYDLAGLTLANRFVMAPMTRGRSPHGVPGEDVARYYARRSHLGLLITEGTYIDHPTAGGSDSVPRMYGEASLAGWRGVVDAVHEAGGRIFPQLWHIGTTRRPGDGPHPEAPVLNPSGLDLNGQPHGRAATLDDIDAIVAGFVRSAKHAQQVGFDGIELHGAHGYLLDSFFWSASNRRDDDYGGSIVNRVRMSTEIVSAIRAEVGADFPISYRFSQWKGGHFTARFADDPTELEQYLAPLTEAGVSAWHVSTRRYWLPAFDGSDRTLAGWTKYLTGLPTIALGSVGVTTPFAGGPAEGTNDLDLAPLRKLFDAGEFDMVGLGRSILSDPEWTLKVRDGRLNDIRLYEKGHEAASPLV